MRTSEQIDAVAGALAKAQAQIQGAVKDSMNPHFRAKYADLASVWDACRDALTGNGLAVLQSPRLTSAAENLWTIEVETILMHGSGQYLADVLLIPVSKLDAQGVGSAITYGRRYALAAFVGVAPEEDDGEHAVGRGQPPATAARPTAKPNGKTTQLQADDDAAARAKANAEAFRNRTPDQIYADAKGAIAKAKVSQLASIRAAATGYGEEGKLTPEHVSTLLSLIEKREEELAVTA